MPSTVYLHTNKQNQQRSHQRCTKHRLHCSGINAHATGENERKLYAFFFMKLIQIDLCYSYTICAVHNHAYETITFDVARTHTEKKEENDGKKILSIELCILDAHIRERDAIFNRLSWKKSVKYMADANDVCSWVYTWIPAKHQVNR